MPINQNEKSLSEVFKELEQSKNKQVEQYKQKQKVLREIKEIEKKKSFVFQVKHRTKKDNLKLIVIVLVICLSISTFSSNYIFAKDLETETEKTPIGTFEENNGVTDVYEIVSENISTTYQKEVLDIEEEIAFVTEYVDNKDLPKGEEVVEQEGIIGHQIVTYVRSYENDEMVDQVAIGYNITEPPTTKIVQVGTSDVLANYNIHIGDYLYATKDLELKKEANDESETLITVPNKYDVMTIEVIEENWMKVSFSDQEGYIKVQDLTSETLTPGSSENCRKQKLLDSVNEEMQLNKPSGLLESDFEKVFLDNSSDTNDIFKENYKSFYEIESKYNINGVFVAAIAIHESNWGRSNIASNKKNLFGYGAYDATPYESAVTFDTYVEGIDTVARWLALNYLNESGTVLPNGETATGRYYNGATVKGVNTRYATDKNWSNRVFSLMKDIYNSI